MRYRTLLDSTVTLVLLFFLSMTTASIWHCWQQSRSPLEKVAQDCVENCLGRSTARVFVHKENRELELTVVFQGSVEERERVRKCLTSLLSLGECKRDRLLLVNSRPALDWRPWVQPGLLLCSVVCAGLGLLGLVRNRSLRMFPYQVGQTTRFGCALLCLLLGWTGPNSHEWFACALLLALWCQCAYWGVLRAYQQALDRLFVRASQTQARPALEAPSLETLLVRRKYIYQLKISLRSPLLHLLATVCLMTMVYGLYHRPRAHPLQIELSKRCGDNICVFEYRRSSGTLGLVVIPIVAPAHSSSLRPLVDQQLEALGFRLPGRGYLLQPGPPAKTFDAMPLLRLSALVWFLHHSRPKLRSWLPQVIGLLRKCRQKLQLIWAWTCRQAGRIARDVLARPCKEFAHNPQLTIQLGTGLEHLLTGPYKSSLARALQLQHWGKLGQVRPWVGLNMGFEISPNHYLILIKGRALAGGCLEPGRLLALGPAEKAKNLQGIMVSQPGYGSGVWISQEQLGDAQRLGMIVYEPAEVIACHFAKVVEWESFQLFSLADCRQLLGSQRHLKGIRRELNKIGLDDLAIWNVLRGLLRENLPIRRVEEILQNLLSCGKAPLARLIEAARQAVVPHECHQWANLDGAIACLVLEADFSETLLRALRQDIGGTQAERLRWEKALKAGIEKAQQRLLQPIFLVTPELRAGLGALLSEMEHQAICLSYAERHPNYRYVELARVAL